MFIESSDTSLKVIDGSHGEGGGQVLRNSISLAAIMAKTIQIHNIRAGRSKPGLKPQHLTGLRLAAGICSGKLDGDKIGSQVVQYSPSKLPLYVDGDRNAHINLVADIGTAGSICLLLQTALPCGLFSKTVCQLILKGGTNASLAPQYDYWELVFLPILRSCFGVPAENFQSKVWRRGYFPRGGGEIHVEIKPLARGLNPIRLLEQGEVQEFYIRSFHAGKIPRHVAQDMADAARSALKKNLINLRGITPSVDIVTEQQYVGSGSGILVVAKTTTGCILAGSALGSPKTKAKETGAEAALELISTLNDGGCVDDWLQDQLIIFMALAEGTSEILTGSLTQHTQTAIWVAQEMCGAEFRVEKVSEKADRQQPIESIYGKDGRIPGRHIIRCKGIGLQPET
jgi:RNA 3'-terminal phosphate cyclase (ATP)